MMLEPYLNFDGRCEEAVNFYCKALGAKIEFMMRFNEMPESEDKSMIPPGNETKIMHASIKIGDCILMASDGGCQNSATFQGVTLSLQVKNAEDAHRLFDALADEGTIQMPLEKTFWSPLFGMVNDKFGVPWMINTVVEEA